MYFISQRKNSSLSFTLNNKQQRIEIRRLAENSSTPRSDEELKKLTVTLEIQSIEAKSGF